MAALELICFCDLERPAGFPQEGISHQSTTHTDAAMDATNREIDPGIFQGGAPGQHMLINAVDQRAVQVEEERLLHAESHRLYPLLCWLANRITSERITDSASRIFNCDGNRNMNHKG